MPYVPDPTNLTLPDDNIIAETAAAEFRALKAYIAGLVGLGGGMNLFRKNLLINGDYKYWRRGTSFVQSAAGTASFIAERFWQRNSAIARTISRQIPGATLPQFKYCMRVARDAANADLTVVAIGSILETIDSLPAASANVTLSFWARMGANFSPAGAALFSEVDTGTGTDEGAALQASSTLTGGVYAAQSNVITANWQRFTQVVAVGATATQIGIKFFWTPVGVAGAADYVEITGVQLEVAGAASPFEYRSLAQELLLCSRYYNKSYDAATNPGTATGVGGCETIASGVTGRYSIRFTPMRAGVNGTVYSTSTGTAAFVRNVTAGADVACTTSTNGEAGFLVNWAAIDQNEYALQWQADAEF